jgi:hypothetical protein
MKQPNPRIISNKADDSIAPGIHSNRIPAHGHGGKLAVMAIVGSRPTWRFLTNLELMTMEMERVDRCIEIIDRKLDNISFLGDVRVDVPVYHWVWVLCPGAEGGEQRRHYLRDVGYVVEAWSGFT